MEQLRLIMPMLADAIKESVPPLDGLEGISFSVGVDRSWSESPKRFVWGPVPILERFDPSKVKIPIEGSVFRQAHEKLLNDAKRKHDLEAEEFVVEYQKRAEEQVRRFIDFVAQTPANPSACTHFGDLAVRMRDQHRPLNLVITDGLFDCAEDRLATHPIAALDGKVVIVVVPSKHANPWASQDSMFKARERDLASMFPSAVILRPYNIESLSAILGGNRLSVSREDPGTTEIGGSTEARMPIRQISLSTPGREHEAQFDSSRVNARQTDVEITLHALIARLQRENVRASWGPNLGECFTNQDLQEMISTRKATKVAETLRHSKSFLKIAKRMNSLAESDRISVEDSLRSALHKTWTERGKVDANGQTVAGVQAELMIASAVIDVLEEVMAQLSAEETIQPSSGGGTK